MKPELINVLSPILLSKEEGLERIKYLSEKYGTLPSDFISFSSRFYLHDGNDLQIGSSDDSFVNNLYSIASSSDPDGIEELNDYLEGEELLPCGCIAVASYFFFSMCFLRLSDGAVLKAYYHDLEYGDKLGNAKRLTKIAKSYSAFINSLSPLDD